MLYDMLARSCVPKHTLFSSFAFKLRLCLRQWRHDTAAMALKRNNIDMRVRGAHGAMRLVGNDSYICCMQTLL